MTDWFRSWHGAPTDPKWRTIAKRANVTPCLVVSVAWVLLDRASQADTRGSIDGTDVETMADFLGCEAEEIERIIAAMHDKAVLASDRFTAWERRQPKREREDETAAERKAAERARKAAKNGSGSGGTEDVTPSHTTSPQVTPREEERRLEQKEGSASLRSAGGQAAAPIEPATPEPPRLRIVEPEILPPEDVDPEKRLFDTGKALLGKSSGGQIAKLLKAAGGDVAKAQAKVDLARGKSDPAEFIAGVIRSATTGPPAKPHRVDHSAEAALEILRSLREHASH